MTDQNEMRMVAGRIRPVYTTRKIGLAELRRLHMAHPDFADSGWAVVKLDGDEETVIDWFADRYAAVEEAERLNREDA